jgi:hypothetical protein
MLKRNRLWVMFLTASLAVTLVTGCSKPPNQEMAAAEKALEEAKLKEAPLYAEEAFKKAEESMNKAKDLIASKTYKEAKQAALETAALAQQALAGVEAGKARMKEETEKTVEQVQAILDELKTAVAAAIKKKLPVAREEVQGAIGKWEVDLAGAKDKIKDGKIREAFDELKSMLGLVNTKKDEISQLAPTAAGEPGKKI